MKVLITGGAGYIGSNMVKRLLDDGHAVIVADSLERGHKEFVDQRAMFVPGDLRDETFVKGLFVKDSYDCVMHFAAFIAVAESMQQPGLYFIDNVHTTILLL